MPTRVGLAGLRPAEWAERPNGRRRRCGEAKRPGSGRNANRRQSWRRQPPYAGCRSSARAAGRYGGCAAPGV
jgi:hypothetical protein